MEIWKGIGKSKGGNVYCVSTMGRVWSSKNGVLNTPTNRANYPHLSLDIDGKWHRHLVHRLEAIAFLPNPENKRTVNHKDGIRWNNNIQNLELATHQEQNIHSVKVLGRKGAKNVHRRKSVIAYKDGLSIVIETNGIREMSRILCIPYQGIQRGIKKKHRKYFGWKFEIIHDPMWTPKKVT